MYLDGALADSASMGGYNITQLGFNTGRFGCGYFYGDPDFNGSINELRIYSGALSASDIANNFAAGPNVLVQPGTFVPKLSPIADQAISCKRLNRALCLSRSLTARSRSLRLRCPARRPILRWSRPPISYSAEAERIERSPSAQSLASRAPQTSQLPSAMRKSPPVSHST